MPYKLYRVWITVNCELNGAVRVTHESRHRRDTSGVTCDNIAIGHSPQMQKM